jgi:hypothetical protein
MLYFIPQKKLEWQQIKIRSQNLQKPEVIK